MIKLQDLIYENIKTDFENDLNNIANGLMKNSNWSPIWDLAKKYPNIFKENEMVGVLDRIQAPLSNRNIIKKKISYTEKITMLLDLVKEEKLLKGRFIDWIKNGTLKVYRGMSHKPNKLSLNNNEYKSFSLNKEYSKKFFQSGWSSGSFVDRNVKGWLLSADISIDKNFHIYNNELGEHEVIVKGPIKMKIIK